MIKSVRVASVLVLLTVGCNEGDGKMDRLPSEFATEPRRNSEVAP